MTTATAAPPSVPMTPPVNPSAEAAQLPTQPTSVSPATDERKGEERPYWGDRFALVFWVWCFGLMGLMHVIDLILSLFR